MNLQGDHFKRAPLGFVNHAIDSKVQMGDLTLFLRKLKNIKSDLWNSCVIFQYDDQLLNVLWRPLYIRPIVFLDLR